MRCGERLPVLQPHRRVVQSGVQFQEDCTIRRCGLLLPSVGGGSRDRNGLRGHGCRSFGWEHAESFIARKRGLPFQSPREGGGIRLGGERVAGGNGRRSLIREHRSGCGCGDEFGEVFIRAAGDAGCAGACCRGGHHCAGGLRRGHWRGGPGGWLGGVCQRRGLRRWLRGRREHPDNDGDGGQREGCGEENAAFWHGERFQCSEWRNRRGMGADFFQPRKKTGAGLPRHQSEFSGRRASMARSQAQALARITGRSAGRHWDG